MAEVKQADPRQTKRILLRDIETDLKRAKAYLEECDLQSAQCVIGYALNNVAKLNKGDE